MKAKARGQLKKWMVVNAVSRVVLAKKLGVSLAMVAHVLNGRRNFHPSRLKKVSAITGISVEQLM